MTPETRAIATIAEIEQRLRDLSRALSAGRRPSWEDAERLRVDVGCLTSTDNDLAPWRKAELHADVQEIVRHALPTPTPPPVVVPAQRGTRQRKRRRTAPRAEVVDLPRPRRASADVDLTARFRGLRRRVDALHDAVEAGQRPTRATFEGLFDELTALRGLADGAEVRQMLDDVQLLHRVVLAAARRLATRRSASRTGRRSLVRSSAEPPPREVRTKRSGGRSPKPSTESAPVDAPLLEEARRLRERAEKFAAATAAGRVLPLRESERLLLHFRILRPQLDADTLALNAVAIRRLAAAMAAATAPRDR